MGRSGWRRSSSPTGRRENGGKTASHRRFRPGGGGDRALTTAWHRQFCPEMGAGFGGAPGMRRLKQTPPGRSSGACRCGGPLAESRGTGSVFEFLQTSQLHTSRRGLKSLDFRPRFSVHSGGPSIRRRAYCAAPGLQPTMRRSSSKSLTAAKCARAHWSFAASTPWGCGALPLVSATK